ncbi:hypothetical protein NQ318_019155, partial [Aromia moschata]
MNMASCSLELKRKVIQDLNEKHGKSLLDLEKCRELHNNLTEQISVTEKELDISNTDCFIGKTIKNAQQTVETADRVIEESRVVVSDIQKDLDEVDEVRKEARKHFNKLNTLQCTLQYMRVIQRIEYLNEELVKEFRKRDDEKCATLFANLTEISRNMADLPTLHIKNYLKEMIHHWHNILKEKLSKDFDEVLKTIKWPFVSANFSLVLPLPTQIQKLQIICEYLLQIEIPSESSVPVVTSALLADFPPLCLPIQLLVQPLRKRFIYHFHGARQTNRPDKPEWYFTQILTWVRDHRDFVVKYIQPVIEKLGLHHIDAKLELIRGLVQLAVEKLYSELPSLQYDDFTFSHSIDEALGFDKELRESYDYPVGQPNASEKMDAMLPPNSSDAFYPLTSEVEDLKITTCADAFITLLQTITERYESLPQPGHRLQFLELQLELLDDFRVRLLQLINAVEGDIIESIIPAIANSIYYMENVLIDWGAMLHFLNLYYYKSQLETARQPSSPILTDFDDSAVLEIETDTVFAETLSLYRHMRRDLLNTLAETVIIEVKRVSKNYRRERWSMMKVEKEFRSLSLTPSACPLFEILSKRLHQLQKSLQSRLFTYVWRSIAQQLDTYLFEDLVLDSRFSEGGALQFKFDITRNLIPLFSQFTDRPNNYFTQVIESCNLLNISKGSALLLRETILALEGATGVEDTRGKALKEMGVKSFTPKMAVKILNQRTDITINSVQAVPSSRNQVKREYKIAQICSSVKQFFVFSKWELSLFEDLVDETVVQAENGFYKQYSIDRAPLRNKYFFGEGYTYGSQLPTRGRGMERLHPKGSVDPIPPWITERIISPLEEAEIVPKGFVNCVAINDYQPGGCIVSHIDPPHIFDRPIVSLSLFSDSALCFGCKFNFKPIRCSRPVLKLDLPRGVVTSLSGFSANEITHCVRPQDVQSRRAVIVLRRVHPFAPRLPPQSKVYLASGVSYKNCHSLKVPKELPADVFMKFYESFSRKVKRTNTFGGVSKPYCLRKIFSNDSKRYSNQPYKLQ